MFCKNCGTNIDDRAVICPHCGIQVGELKPTNEAPISTDPANETKANNTVGLVGFILAMAGTLLWIIYVSASAAALFYLALGVLIAGIVCSAIGMKRVKKLNAGYKGFSVAGLVVSIVFVALTVIFFIIGLSILLNA